jgi:hypothetical protein
MPPVGGKNSGGGYGSGGQINGSGGQASAGGGNAGNSAGSVGQGGSGNIFESPLIRKQKTSSSFNPTPVAAPAVTVGQPGEIVAGAPDGSPTPDQVDLEQPTAPPLSPQPKRSPQKRRSRRKPVSTTRQAQALPGQPEFSCRRVSPAVTLNDLQGSGGASPMTTRKSAPRRRRTKAKAASGAGPFNSRNDFVADYLKFNAWIDDCLGVTPSLDRAPYNLYNPVRVGPLLDELKIASEDAAS